MKKWMGIAGCMALVCLLAVNAAASGRGAGVVKSAGRLQVIGNHVRGEKIPDQNISLAGMSFFWSNWDPQYYNAATVDYLVDNFQVSLVRAAYGAPHNGAPDGDFRKIEAVVDAAIARDIYVIIDWHTEGNAFVHEAHAKEFFAHFSAKYADYPHVIYELWNEPIDWNIDALKRWCTEMAGIIRANDPDNLIICGSPTWSQYPQSYTITDPNVAYTFHGYFDHPEYGPGHVDQFYRNVEAAMNQGSAVFVTEFGAHEERNLKTGEIMNACIERGISMAAWSVFDKIEPWSIFEHGSGLSRLTDIGRFYQSRMIAWPEIHSDDDDDFIEIPGKIEAENFADSFGIRTQPTTDEGGGANIGWIENNDWAEYKVNVTRNGMYAIHFRVAGDTAGGLLSLQRNGTPLADIQVTNTGGWQSWRTITAEAYLEKGEQTLKLLFSSSGTESIANLNYMIFEFSGYDYFEIPGKIEAEDYADSYGIDVEPTTDDGGGANIGWIENQDWAEYTVNVKENGLYKIRFRVASNTAGGQISLQKDGTPPADIQVTSTGGWQSWQTVDTEAYLEKGEQTFKLLFLGSATEGMLNLNYMVFDYLGNDFCLLPGKLEAENYTDSVGIDTEPTTDDGGGANIGWIGNGDWASYKVHVAKKGEYKISFRVASNTGGGKISLFNDNNFITDVAATNTGGWQSWRTVTAKASLDSGIQTFKLVFTGGTNDLLNLNWLVFEDTDTPDPSWKLVWSDEFNYTGSPDSGKWGYDMGGHGWGNYEKQYYTDRLENARVENGHLVIEARKENFGANNYTSARLFSRGQGDWRYGKMEIRAKLPWGRGTWPAIWMLPTDWEYGNWPLSGEIDIMEHVGYDQGRIVGTVHTKSYNHTNGTQRGGSVYNDSVSDAHHTYSIEWDPEKIDFFMDGNKYFTFMNEHTGFAEWPFDKRFHLMLNIAVGGTWGGAHGIDDSIFPQKMEIDYVRVYQQASVD